MSVNAGSTLDDPAQVGADIQHANGIGERSNCGYSLGSYLRKLDPTHWSMPVASETDYVTLTSVAEAYCTTNDHQSNIERAQTFGVLWEKYSARWGTVFNSHFCTYVPAACVYLRNSREGGDGAEHQLELAFPPKSGAPGWVSDLLVRCNGLQADIRQTSGGRDARLCSELVFLLVTQLLKLLDQYAVERITTLDRTIAGQLEPGAAPAVLLSAPPVQGESAEQILFQKQFAEIHEFFVRSNQRTAQLLYFLGMVTCWLALVLIVAGAATGVRTFGLLEALGLDGFQMSLALAGLLVGGLGAIVSVMQRMTAGQLTVNYRVDRTTMMMLGVIRPLIGSMFAVLLFALLMGSLIPMATMPSTSDPTRLIYTYGAIAFFAGFSERWAQDMIAAGVGRIGLTARDAVPQATEAEMSSARSARV